MRVWDELAASASNIRLVKLGAHHPRELDVDPSVASIASGQGK